MAVREEASAVAWYAANRAAVLFVAAVLVTALRTPVGVQAIGWSLVGVQLADAVTGMLGNDPITVAGPAALAVLTATVLLLARRSAVGRRRWGWP